MTRPIPIKNLKPGLALERPLFREDGRLLLAAGSRVTYKHLAILERAGVSQVIECDRELDGFALGEPPTSRPVAVSSLEVGSVVSRPLYTEEGLLLLSQGSVFTADYQTALERGGIDTVFARGPETLLPDIEYIQAVAESVAADCDQALLRRRDQGPAEPAWSGSFQPPTTGRRLPETVAAAVSGYENKVYMVEDLFSRILRNGRIREADLFDSAEGLMGNIESDKALSLALTGLRSRDNHYVFRHSLNAALFSATIAATLGYGQGQALEVTVAALIQDIGMMVVPQAIVNLSRTLSPSEKNLVSRHVLNSLGLHSDLGSLPEPVTLAVYQHHERDDGSGYPKKTGKDGICPYAKILAVADTYSALTSARAYRQGLAPYKAMEKTIRMAGQGLLCRACARAFLEAVSLFPVGSFVRLSNRRAGQVVAGTGNYAKPVVRVMFDERQRPLSGQEYTVNLEEQGDVSVTDISGISELKTKVLAGF